MSTQVEKGCTSNRGPISPQYMGVSENSGFSPQIIHFNRVFHYFHHPFWGTVPIFGNPHNYREKVPPSIEKKYREKYDEITMSAPNTPRENET